MNKNFEEKIGKMDVIESALLYFDPDDMHEFCRKLTWVMLTVIVAIAILFGLAILNQFLQARMALAKKRDRESDRRRTKIDNKNASQCHVSKGRVQFNWERVKKNMVDDQPLSENLKISDAIDLKDERKKYLTAFVPSKEEKVSSSYKYVGTMSDMI